MHNCDGTAALKQVQSDIAWEQQRKRVRRSTSILTVATKTKDPYKIINQDESLCERSCFWWRLFPRREGSFVNI
jgi:hypothetical protein